MASSKQTFVHILQSCNQGSSTVILLLEHVLRTLKTDNPEIQYAYFRQDNAGCYHSAKTIVAIPAIQLSSGVSVLAVEFSDPPGRQFPFKDEKAYQAGFIFQNRTLFGYH